MVNFFVDLTIAILNTLSGLMVYLFILALLAIVLNFVIKLLKKEEFRKVNVEAYKDWVAACKNGTNKRMVNLWTVGTKKMSEAKIDKIHGHLMAYLPEPDKHNYRDGTGILSKSGYNKALKGYASLKKKNMHEFHVFAVRSWWKIWKPYLLYIIPTPLLVDDLMIGDIFINTAGFLPCLHHWRIPSNVNRKQFVDAIKTNSIYVSYEQDWEYMGNVAQRAIEAENQFLKAKGIKETILGVFDRKKGGGEKK